jgi:hypothetical protein
LVQLAPATADGVRAEAGDARQQGDATTTVLLGQEADEEPAIPLVDSGDDAVEGAMLVGGAAPGVLAASGTVADVDRQRLMESTHRPYLLFEGRREQQGHYNHESGKLFLHSALDHKASPPPICWLEA